MMFKHFSSFVLLASHVASSNSKPALDILIPMAGLGSRFTMHPHYQNAPPKPLIKLPDDRTLIEVALADLIPKRFEARYLFVVRSLHRKDHDLTQVLSLILLRHGVDPKNIVVMDATDASDGDDETTSGPAVTALRAMKLVLSSPNYPTTPLLIANCDQHINWGEGKTVDDFVECAHAKMDTVGCLFTYKSEPDASKSYVKIDENTGFATSVKEKEVISTDASTGLYLFRSGVDFWNGANEMIERGDLKVNGEWYVAPVYNFLLDKGVRKFEVAEFWNTGTPESLEEFIE